MNQIFNFLDVNKVEEFYLDFNFDIVFFIHHLNSYINLKTIKLRSIEWLYVTNALFYDLT